MVLRSPRNWTAVVFLALLGCIHLAVAIPAILVGRWEGYLSVVLFFLFGAGALLAAAFRSELALQPSHGRIVLRTGVGRWCSERFIPFDALRGVRLTTTPGRRGAESRIEILCPFEQIECPPTAVPRQEALLLAMALEVPLIKVCQGDSSEQKPARARGRTWSTWETPRKWGG
jgi:hypothetical protein